MKYETHLTIAMIIVLTIAVACFTLCLFRELKIL